jgi:hypothetical protein
MPDIRNFGLVFCKKKYHEQVLTILKFVLYMSYHALVYCTMNTF